MAGDKLDLLQIMLQSSWVVQFILILLLVLSVFSWGIVFYYWNFYKKAILAEQEYLKFFDESQQEMITKDTLYFLTESSKRYERSMCADLFLHLIETLKKRPQSDITKQVSRDLVLSSSFQSTLNRVMEHKMIDQLQLTDRYRPFLANIATTAPFIGLLGTVLGIVGAFSGMATGAGSIESIAPGIAEALVATAVGLGAAIPASWFFNHFAQKLKLIKQLLHKQAGMILNMLEKVE